MHAPNSKKTPTAIIAGRKDIRTGAEELILAVVGMQQSE
jgi:hypothetical protein